MIDILDEVFAIVAEAAQNVAPEVTVQDDYIDAVSSFPVVTVAEINNSTSAHTIGSRPKENYAAIAFKVEVFSNKVDGKRSECRRIMSAISDALILRNFNRISMQPTPNYRDATVYRLTARFEVVSDSNKQTYRR